MKVVACGRANLLVDGLDAPAEWVEGLRQANVVGVGEFWCGEDSVMVRCDPEKLNSVAQRLESIQPSPLISPDTAVRLAVRYGGPGLAAVAAATGLSEESVVFRHRSCTYTARFCAAQPGRWFLSGLDSSLVGGAVGGDDSHAPCVAIVGGRCVVSPDGRDLNGVVLGTLDVSVWDQQDDPPSALRTGSMVQFEPVATP